MKHRLAETGKNILIVLLSCSLILLTLAVLPSQWIHSTPGLSQLLQPVAPLLGLPEAELTYVAEAAPMPDAARPIAISIKNRNLFRGIVINIVAVFDPFHHCSFGFMLAYAFRNRIIAHNS